MCIVLNVDDRGLLYAEACFETFRVIHGTIFNWREHEARLRRGLEIFGLECPDGLKKLCVVEADRAASDALVRVTVTGGDAPRGLLPECGRKTGVYIQAWPYEARTEGIHLRTVLWPLPLYPRPAKLTADYAQTIRGLHELEDKGLLAKGEEALVCDAEMLYSAPTSNIMLFMDGTWMTPNADSVVPGVVRHTLIEYGVVRACPCPHALAEACEAIALTNSGWFIRPVATINGRTLRMHGAPFEQLVAVLTGQAGIPEGLPCA